MSKNPYEKQEKELRAIAGTILILTFALFIGMYVLGCEELQKYREDNIEVTK